MPKRKRLPRKTPSGFFTLRDVDNLTDDQLTNAELNLTFGSDEHRAVRKEMKRRGIW